MMEMDGMRTSQVCLPLHIFVSLLPPAALPHQHQAEKKKLILRSSPGTASYCVQGTLEYLLCSLAASRSMALSRPILLGRGGTWLSSEQKARDPIYACATYFNLQMWPSSAALYHVSSHARIGSWIGCLRNKVRESALLIRSYVVLSILTSDRLRMM